MLSLLSRMLSQLGYENVVACTCGEEAVRQIAMPGPRFDLVILDINMPGMDGVEFIRRLVKGRYGGSVLLVSGESDRSLGSVERLIEAHHITSLGHLQKPVAPALLVPLLAGLLPYQGFSRPLSGGRQAYCADEVHAAIVAGELVNHYQPKVDLATGEIVGMESLVRWRHPLDGLIYPYQFVATAEENGLISELTHVVVAAAMEHVKSWWTHGHRFPVAVNVSMADLTVLDLPDVLELMADAAGISPELITLEVTESRGMNQFSTVLDVLSRLRLKRFRLAIDDFGMGHSSLAQLRDLPFDEIKIDRSFIHGGARDPKLHAICNASVRMAQHLGMRTVAKG
ncbi:MAG: EAL domain-containing response regulator [Gammaproteobacteria bacterium]